MESTEGKSTTQYSKRNFGKHKSSMRGEEERKGRGGIE